MNRDASLINGLKNRNESCFRDVYYSYNRLIYYIAFSILKNKDDAEEVVQDTFVRLMENIDRYNHQGRFRQYIASLAKSTAIDHYRKQKKVLTDEYDENMASANEDPKADVLLTLEMTLLPDEAYIVSLHIVYDFTFKEIADDLQESIGTIQAKYYKAIKKLKNYYKKEEK